MMPILYGYISLCAYFGLVFLINEFLIKRFLPKYICRKIVHIFAGLSFFIYNFFIGNSYHQIIISGCFLIFTIISKRFLILKSIENNEKHNYGTIFYSTSLLTLMTLSYFLPELYKYVWFAILALCFGDGFSTIFGKLIKSPKIHNNKTIVGFVACFLFSLGSFALYNYLFSNLFAIYELILLAMISAIAEEIDFGLDNFTVPFLVFAGAYLINAFGTNMDYALLIFVGVFLVGFFSKAMTYYGTLIASCIGMVYFIFGGLYSFIFLLSGYVILIVIDIIRKIKKASVDGIVKKTKGKDIIQVFANGLFPLVLMIIYGITNISVFLVASLVTIANGFVDSVASDVGSMSKAKPFDIFKRKYVTNGISGGITLLGTLSSFIASIAFALAIKYIADVSWLAFAIFIVITNVCCFLDTLMGSMLQVKYKCIKCGEETEKEMHCDEPTTKISGVKYIDNDAVNFLSSFACSCLSLLLWLL